MKENKASHEQKTHCLCYKLKYFCVLFFKDRITEFSQFSSLVKASGTCKYSIIFHIEILSVGGRESEG